MCSCQPPLPLESQLFLYLGLNMFSDMTPQEKNQYLGFNVSLPHSTGVPLPLSSAGPAADSMDWRELGGVTPVKNQGRSVVVWNNGPWLADNQSSDLNTELWLVVYSPSPPPLDVDRVGHSELLAPLRVFTLARLRVSRSLPSRSCWIVCTRVNGTVAKVIDVGIPFLSRLSG